MSESRQSSKLLLLSILSECAPYTGVAFFEAAVRSLANALAVPCVAVSELLLDAERARTVACIRDEELIASFEYHLPGSPYAEVIQQERVAFSDNVSQRFPQADFLVEMNARSYAGVLLKSQSGLPIGLLSIAHRVAMPEPEPALELLEQFAPRVAAELERRQWENSLRRNEARFRLLAEKSRDILFYYQLRPEPKFEYISPAVEQITGLPPEAFSADPGAAIQMLESGSRSRVMNAITSGSEEPVVAKIQLPNGEERWVEYRNFPLVGESGKLTAVGGSIRDITSRMQALEALQKSEEYRGALLEAVPDPLLRLDAEGEILDYIAGEDPLTGFLQYEGELVGRRITEVVPETCAKPITNLIHDAMRSRKLRRIECEVTSGGESRFYEMRCLPFSRREVIMLMRDFTAMRWHQREPQRRQLRDEIDRRIEGLANPYGLTYRELAVLHLVAEGWADKQIAEALGISIYTVNKHVANILGKMNAASRTEAGVRALKEGVLG